MASSDRPLRYSYMVIVRLEFRSEQLVGYRDASQIERDDVWMDFEATPGTAS